MEHSQGGGNARCVLVFLAFLVSLLVSGNIHAVQAAKQHQVGGPPGWSLPELSKVNYTVWASNQTFTMGDTLYFNYSKAYHNVLEVTKANYESCDASNPKANWTDGADIIPLNSSGTFYYICGIPGHCEEGQKVAVEVVAAKTGVQHQVGGNPGWSLPSMSNVNYTVWANDQTFAVGDTLYFNYSKQYHNVLQVTKANYEACVATDPIKQWDDGATIIPLNMTGTFYYICGITGHCGQGQKVAVTVVESGSPATTGGAPGPAGSTAPSLPPASSSPLSHPISASLLALTPIMISVCLMSL